jgi:hypothetical protein
MMNIKNLKAVWVTGIALLSAQAQPALAIQYSGNTQAARQAYPALKQAYCSKFAHGDRSCTLTGVRVISGYAAFDWQHNNAGASIEGPGIAKLTGSRWAIVTVGGGAMLSNDAISAGVPRSIAEMLVPMSCPSPDDTNLDRFTAWNLIVCRNSTYARYGRSFTYKPLRDYFMSWPWYKPGAFSDSMLSADEKAYVERLYQYEKRMGYL